MDPKICDIILSISRSESKVSVFYLNKNRYNPKRLNKIRMNKIISIFGR